MKRVLLVFPSYYWDAEKKKPYNLFLPLGLGYIAASLKEIGCDARIFDVMGRGEELIKLINKYSPHIVGLSCMTTNYPELKNTVELIREKSDFSGKLIAGGPHITLEPEKTLKQLNLDACVIGEAEKTMQELVLTDDWSRVKGLYLPGGFTAPREKIGNLDEIPFPAFELFELNRYEKCVSGKTILIMPSRGCPYKCIFCSSKHLEGNLIRFRSPENVIEEMNMLKGKFGFSRFFMGSDTFVINKKWIERFADLVESEDISFHCNGRINLMTKDLLSDLKRAGCCQIDYGIESAVQRVLDTIKKEIKFKDIEKVVKMTTDMGFSTNLYFMLSLPGETLDDMKKTIRFAKKMEIKYKCRLDFQITRVYPGTPLARTVNLNKENWAETVHEGLRYCNVPCYLEYPMGKVYNLWKRARKESRLGKAGYIGRRIVYADSKREAIKWLAGAFQENFRRKGQNFPKSLASATYLPSRIRKSGELQFWRKELRKYVAWYEGKIPVHYGIPTPSAQDKIRCYSSIEDNAVMTWSSVNKKYLSKLDLPPAHFNNKRILDVGCGPSGHLSDFEDCERYGLDSLIDKYLELGYPLFLHDIKYFCFEAEDMCFPTDFFDAVISVNALDHVDDFEAACSEIVRVLKPGGELHVELHYHRPVYLEPHELTDERVTNAFGGLRRLYKVKSEPTEGWSNAPYTETLNLWLGIK